METLLVATAAATVMANAGRAVTAITVGRRDLDTGIGADVCRRGRPRERTRGGVEGSPGWLVRDGESDRVLVGASVAVGLKESLWPALAAA